MKKFSLFLLITTLIWASEIPVNIDDDIYPFLKRMENRNIISLNAAIYPFTRNQIADLLKEISPQQSKLSPTEQILLSEFIADFRYELQKNNHPDLSKNEHMLVPFFSNNGTARVAKNIFSRKHNQESSHLFTYEEDDFFIWGDAKFRIEQQYKNEYSRYLISDRYFLQGGLNKYLSFHIDFFRYQREKNDNYSELTLEEKGLWTNETEGDYVLYDNVYSSFVYNYKNLNIGLYHQPLIWGTSFENSLIMSGTAPAFTYLGFDFNYKALQFSFIHGSLLNDSTGINGVSQEVENMEKYIAAHRIDLALFGGSTRIGLTEMVIYGDRNIEPGYLLPVNFYWSIEHTLQDRDNSLMAFDFQTNAIPHCTIYGTFFLDEMKFSELFNDWWGNKHGIQLGARFSNELFSLPMDWTAETTHLRPWTYTHKYFTNNYTNAGLPIGLPYSGNTRLYQLTNNTTVNRRTRFKLSYTYLKHGYDDDENYYGGDPTISYELRNEDLDYSTEWLMGDIQTDEYLLANLRYEIYNDTFINLEAIQYFSGDKDTYINFGINLDF